MLVNPEDREPQSSAAIADRLRNSHDVQWSDLHVKDALDRLTRIFGGDEDAAGKARSGLAHLAQRSKPIKSLPAWLSRLSDDELRDECADSTGERPPRPPCRTCNDVRWLGEDPEGRAIRCADCRQDGAGGIAAQRPAESGTPSKVLRGLRV